MNELIYAGNQTLYMILKLSVLPISVATAIGLIVGVIQTLTQLQEQTLSYGIKLLGVFICLFISSGWIGESVVRFSLEFFDIALGREN